jgi:hypothetical protein
LQLPPAERVRVPSRAVSAFFELGKGSHVAYLSRVKLPRLAVAFAVAFAFCAVVVAAFRPYHASNTIMVELLDENAPADVLKAFWSMSPADVKELLAANDLSVKVEELPMPEPPKSSPEKLREVHERAAELGVKVHIRKRYDRRLFRLTVSNVDRVTAAAHVNAATQVAARELNDFSKQRLVDRGFPVDPPAIHLEQELFQRLLAATDR